uniref:Ig-like domain-containing protein n=1 Tax=Anguilla anguilla TaxID=7936 RepID=A0A0E9XQI2_ANGAN
MASLYCQYDTTSGIPELFWYIQQENKSPELILSNYNTRGNGYKEGLTAADEKSNKTYNLKIAAAVLSDSATYYCALRPTLCESVSHLVPKPPSSVSYSIGYTYQAFKMS